MRYVTYILIALALVLASCGGSPEITLENATPLESAAASTQEADDGAAEAAAESADAEQDEAEEQAEATPADEPAPVQVTTEEAAAAAEANMALLAGGETVFDYDVLDVQTGGISSVGEVVDGDRSVLLWFFSPH